MLTLGILVCPNVTLLVETRLDVFHPIPDGMLTHKGVDVVDKKSGAVTRFSTHDSPLLLSGQYVRFFHKRSEGFEHTQTTNEQIPPLPKRPSDHSVHPLKTTKSCYIIFVGINTSYMSARNTHKSQGSTGLFTWSWFLWRGMKVMLKCI